MSNVLFSLGNVPLIPLTYHLRKGLTLSSLGLSLNMITRYKYNTKGYEMPKFSYPFNTCK